MSATNQPMRRSDGIERAADVLGAPVRHVTYAKVVCAARGEALDPRAVDVELADRGGA